MKSKSNKYDRGVVYAGMYALGPMHRAAWQNWFDELSKLVLNLQYDSVDLQFSNDEVVYTDPNTILAQTCGYPYVNKWMATHELVAVPIFNVAGCGLNSPELSKAKMKASSALYSSWFITHADNPDESLGQFHGKCVAINSEDSNSGMNVLRYAISKVAAQKRFFDKRLITGSHLKSMQAIAEGSADLASIDAVSYALITEFDPSLIERIKVIGQSEMTVGLPFICATQAGIDQQALCVAMDQAVKKMEPRHRNTMHLTGFQAVNNQGYQRTRELELRAVASGYPELR